MEYTEYEAAVLGACMMEPACVAEVADFLRPADFYHEPHREIYTALLDLWSVNTPINMITIKGRLLDKGKLDTVGGDPYLAILVCELPDVVSMEFYAEKIKSLSLQRNIRAIGKLMQSDERDPHEALHDYMERLVEASSSSLRSIPRDIGENIERVCGRAIRINDGDEENDAILTGMPRFDSLTGGLKPSDFIIVGARPSVGKSAFAIHLAKQLADSGNRVLFFSLEMSSDQIATRMLAAESGVPYNNIQDGYLSKAHPGMLTEAAGRLRNLPFPVDDKSGQSITDIRIKTQRESVTSGVDIVIVDYIQIAAKHSTDYHEVTMVSNGLKAIAKDLRIPVIGLAQLSRGVEQRDSRKPMLSDLKQTGALEQDADLVFQMWYPDLRDMEEVELLLTKHRNGSLGKIRYKFEKDIQVFTEAGGGA